MDVSLDCEVCGQHTNLTDAEMPQVELFMGIWDAQHSHTRHEVGRWYETQLQAHFMSKGIGEPMFEVPDDEDEVDWGDDDNS